MYTFFGTEPHYVSPLGRVNHKVFLANLTCLLQSSASCSLTVCLDQLSLLPFVGWEMSGSLWVMYCLLHLHKLFSAL